MFYGSVIGWHLNADEMLMLLLLFLLLLLLLLMVVHHHHCCVVWCICKLRALLAQPIENTYLAQLIQNSYLYNADIQAGYITHSLEHVFK